MAMRHWLGTWFIALGGLLLVGCASPWEKNFQRNDWVSAGPGAVAAPTPNVEVRQVAYERVRAYERAEHDRDVQSTTAPADLSPAQRSEVEDRLLEALQVRGTTNDVDMLGWSDFYDTEAPSKVELVKFAKKIGADSVVVAETPAGKVTTIQHEPVHSDSQGWTSGSGFRGGRRRGSYFYSDQSTTWVPIAVTENETRYEAFYLRRRNGGQ